MQLSTKHLLGIRDLATEDIQIILDTATQFKEVLQRPIKKVPSLRDITIVNLFYENSTRTRISFELAEKRLSADTINFTASGSSVSKGETFKSGSYYYEYLTSLAAKDFFNNGGQTLLVTRVISSGSSNMSTYASATVTSTNTSSSFVVETLAWGDIMNNTSSMTNGALASGSATNVRWEVTQVSTGSGTFTLAVRAGNDNTSQPNYLETWNNLSLDPAQPNYISRVIGDFKPVYSLDSDGAPIITSTGSYSNASQYIRVRSVSQVQVDSVDNNGNYKSASLASGLPALGSGSFGGSFAGGLPASAASVQLMNESITNGNVQGFAPADYTAAFNLLTNKDEYQFNVLLAPGVTLGNSAVSKMISVCEDRGDAIAIVDTTLYGQTVTAAGTAAAGQSSNYAATYWPWIHQRFLRHLIQYY